MTILAIDYKLWRKVDRRGADDCWEWVGVRDKDGYGYFRVGTRTHFRVHRASWEIHNGPIPDGLEVLHRCDNPPCVNPAHLWLGTARDNQRDKWAKGRGIRHSGEKNSQATLTEDDVREIRRRYAAGGETFRSLAGEFGVCFPHIGLIVRRERWADI